jgi:hypothetical protein
VKREAIFLPADEKEKEEELLHLIRLLTVDEVEANSAPVDMKKPKRGGGGFSRVYFSYLLAKFLHRRGAQAILAHVHPLLNEDVEYQALVEQESQLDEYIAKHGL